MIPLFLEVFMAGFWPRCRLATPAIRLYDPCKIEWIRFKTSSTQGIFQIYIANECSLKTNVVDLWPSPISASSTVIMKKSAFIAYATSLQSSDAESALKFLTHLTTSSQYNVKRASHIMHAYQFTNPVTTDFDDGGERGAGERLENLLKMSCSNKAVVVVVIRWHGGIKLGNNRWKCISQVAKEALAKGGFSN